MSVAVHEEATRRPSRHAASGEHFGHDGLRPRPLNAERTPTVCWMQLPRFLALVEGNQNLASRLVPPLPRHPLARVVRDVV